MRRSKSNGVPRLSKAEKSGFYKAVFGRRDVRGHFKTDPLPEDAIARILNAAHHAGSVGFMQPWNFILIKDIRIKRKVKAIFLKANARAAAVYQKATRDKYRSMKLEGILEAPLNICVTCDPTRGGPHVLGRHSIPETDLYSTCCAIQNLWLAARAEGIGVGWVSILHNGALRKVLKIPPRIIPVAYLCLGYVREFLEKPELELAGWRHRHPLQDLIFYNQWGQSPKRGWALLNRIIRTIRK